MRNRSIVGPRPLALGCGTAAAILLVAGAALQVTDGAPGRLPDSLKLLAAQGEVGASPAHCREQTEIAQPLDCTLGDPKAPPSIALWGDSFAGTLASVLGPPLAKEGLRAVRFVVHACPSIAGVMRKPARLGQAFGVSCHDYAERVLSVLRQSDQIRTVILYSSLSLYFETFTEDTGPIRANAASASTSEDGRREVLSERIIATARALAESGKTVILVGAHPKSTVADPHRVLSWALTHGEILLPPDEPRESFELSIAGINSRLREGAAKSQILFVDPDAIFCGEGQGRCSFMKGERFLLSDGVHLSKLGSSLLVEEIMSRLAPRSGSRVGRNEGGFDGRDLTEMSPAEH